MKKNQYINVINLVIALLVLVLGDVYVEEGGLFLKGLASVGFAVMGAINAFYVWKNGTKHLKFALFMMMGLTLCWLGDIAINIEFIAGAAVFALGHVFYFVAYCAHERFRMSDLIMAAIIFLPALAFITFAPMFDFGSGVLYAVCAVYAVIISCMVGKALAILIKRKTFSSLFTVVGCALFFFSDLMLVIDFFGGGTGIIPILCMSTYYPAQCILAYSVLLIPTEATEI